MRRTITSQKLFADINCGMKPRLSLLARIILCRLPYAVSYSPSICLREQLLVTEIHTEVALIKTAYHPPCYLSSILQFRANKINFMATKPPESRQMTSRMSVSPCRKSRSCGPQFFRDFRVLPQIRNFGRAPQIAAFL